MRKCPFHPKKYCGQSVTACVNCEYRKRVQKILTAEPPEPKRMKIEMEILSRDFTCSYCLFTGNLSKFQTRLKSGEASENRFVCPDCGQGMRRNTLFKDLSVEEFAVWIYDTQAWDRVSFGKFKQRLKDMGISNQFWEAYKKHKHEMSEENESYEDYVIRKQQEEHDEETAYTDMHGE